ncbi:MULTISPECIES: RNA deprotection pyrophosphohydrolase [Staphylococcus]|uniref:Nucleoside triphosphatase YtkD n=1 Tax=Staphylococcus hsinchuensis TaxID=3051183 RepID=A0ABZ3ED95_9STAP|nr:MULTISPECIES: nucleoside triphosphatase YtkD [unclassified Staphylococcus]
MHLKFIDQENDDVYLNFKNEHDNADGQHVLVIPIYHNKLLFTKHKQRGIEFPGGKVEPGELSLEAAKRELLEETGARAKTINYLAQYYVDRTNGKGFSKDVYVVHVAAIEQQDDYLETLGPILYRHPDEVPGSDKSYLLKDPAILYCLERVIELGFYQ